MKRTMLLIMLVLSLLLTLTVVSASDINDTTDTIKKVKIADKDNADIVNEAKKPKKVGQTENCEDSTNGFDYPIYKEYTDGKTEARLREDVLNNLTNNTKIYLSNGNYKIDTINLNNNITIIGEDCEKTIITSNTTKGMFNIPLDCSLTLINITLDTYESNDSAAINNDGKLIINGSIFKNVKRESRTANGGVIFNTGTLVVDNSTFDTNEASYGAGIYGRNSTINVTNSVLNNHYTTNVGGSIYAMRSNITIANTTFTENRAVSGGAIYNAFGLMNVSDCVFYKNEAHSFYGGAIYNTGTTTTENSIYYANDAHYEGGAITNTHIFNSINCTFEQNFAGVSGGVIENTAFDDNELGRVTLINSTFSENSAIEHGGVIINTKNTESDKCGIITARNCVFKSNTAGEKGGVIFNNKYVDLEYNVFASNEAENATVINNANVATGIISLENNWWGTSNPNWSKIGVNADKWVVMSFTNTSTLLQDLECDFEVTLDKLNDNKTLSSPIPTREVIYLGDKTVYYDNFQKIDKRVTNRAIARDDVIKAQIDDEKIELHPSVANISYKFVNDYNSVNISFNLPENINTKTSIKINGQTMFKNEKIVNGKLSVVYDIPTSWTKENYTISVVFNTSDGKVLRKNITMTIVKRNVTTTVNVTPSSEIERFTTLTIRADVKIANKSVDSGYVSFKINGVTIKSNVKVVNGSAMINYTLGEKFKLGKYNISVVYSGDANKNSDRVNTTIEIVKHKVHVEPSSLELMEEVDVVIRMKLLDSNDNFVEYGKVCYKINGITIKTNITLEDGTFLFEYTTPKAGTGNTMQTLTVKLQESSYYEAMSVDIPIRIE
ncbi:MAG: hypothetical protein BZ136_06900 [Methanosphaera sp. rholeuAM74]|nr:MAG: hypothetical protein BZ136_06900 [Methanosphaera sp. rholeuAM74]